MLWLDSETFNTLDLKKVGGYRYAETCELMLLGWAIRDEPFSVWDRTLDPTPPPRLQEAFFSDMPRCAHHSMFDRPVLRETLDWEVEIDLWRDSMVKAYTCGLPGSLDVVGRALDLPQDYQKLADGKRLVNKFCKPAPKNHNVDRYTRENAPEDWARFVTYCGQDVEAMRAIYTRLPDWNYHGKELALWHLDQKINDRGLPVDVQLASRAIALTKHVVAGLNQELTEITQGQVTAASQVQKLVEWCRAQGVVIMAGTKAAVLDCLARPDTPPHVRRALEIRQQVGRTSTAKHQAIIDAVSSDGRLRGTLQFYGALRTARWAGRKFQPQNLARPKLKDLESAAASILNGNALLLYDDPMGLVSDVVRPAVCASEGHQLITADLANIEGRGLAWLAGEEWKLQAFRDYDAGIGPDLYKLSYSRAFGTPVDEVDDLGRQIGKVQELALGYSGGVGAYVTMAKTYNLDLEAVVPVVWPTITRQEMETAEWMWKHYPLDVAKEIYIACDVIKQRWRTEHPQTVSWWHQLEWAAKSAVIDGSSAYAARSVSFAVRRGALLCRLPSSRFLVYNNVNVDEEGLSYMGVDQTRRSWERIRTYGGKLAENTTQAVARDILAYNMPAIEQAGYPLITTVHDEDVTECPLSGTQTVDELCRFMTRVPDWAPGLPLAAEGWAGKRYRK